jgi:hypothetical protein
MVDVYDAEDVAVALGYNRQQPRQSAQAAKPSLLTAHDLRIEDGDKDRDDRKDRAGKHERE